MASRFNPARALRALFFVALAIIAAVAIIDSALAIVLVIMGVGLLVAIVPFVAIHYDEHPERLQRRHPAA